ncbi:unnamed protein product, partial [Polarella glacialis]
MNPEGASAEELLWSLGVGSDLPAWLKELREKERVQGLNQESRASRQRVARPGLGPQLPRSGPSEGDSQELKQAPPAAASEAAAKPYAVPAVPSPYPSSSSTSRVASVDAPKVSEASPEELRVDPDDGKQYTLQGIRTKYQGHFSEDEIATYFDNDCAAVE